MRIVSKLQTNISASYLRQLRKTLLRRYESILWILVIALNFKGRESVIWNSIQLRLLLLANLGQVFTGVSIEAGYQRFTVTVRPQLPPSISPASKLPHLGFAWQALFRAQTHTPPPTTVYGKVIEILALIHTNWFFFFLGSGWGLEEIMLKFFTAVAN